MDQWNWMVFWITSPIKAKREQVDDKLMVIKLFASNYARFIIINIKARVAVVAAATSITFIIIINKY